MPNKPLTIQVSIQGMVLWEGKTGSFCHFAFSLPSGPIELRARWPSTEWETGPAQKSEKNGKENGKTAPGLKWPKHGRRNRKNREKMAKIPFFLYFFHFGGHFSAISGRGPFSIFFPIFFGFLRWTGFPFCRWPPRTQR